jgi:ABC-type multidrug transport system fused ATPase/permease subunit
MTASLQEVRIFDVGANIERRLGDQSAHVSELEMRANVRGGLIPAIYQGTAMLLIVCALSIVYSAGLTGLASLGGVVLIMLRSLTSAQGVQSSIQGMHTAAPYAEMLLAEKARLRAAAVSEGGDPIAHLAAIEFRDVTFAYQPEVKVLRSVTFVTRPGEIIGIVGPSGAGKSTLVQLLLRLRDPISGSILADGRDVRELSLHDWYQRMTFVPQEAHLFAGTVADNIRFFRDDVDQSAIERAAKLAHIHDDIVDWPLGYDTPVGERGGQLSGGQRQRMCIARALVGDPDVVVLDEPTSALDVKSESLLRETLESLAPSKTVIVIAHRLSTLSICGRIMIILNGEMQGFDTPEQLERSNPFYREALILSGMR